MSSVKRRKFWIDAPLQLHMLGFIMMLVTASLLLVSFSVIRGLQEGSAQSEQMFHTLPWILTTLGGPLLLSALIALVASALLALIWSHRLAGPLRVLSAGFARMKHGNLSISARIRATDTHQELVHEFAQMQSGLKELVHEDKRRVEQAVEHLGRAAEAVGENHPARAEIEEAARALTKVGSHFSL